MGKYDATDITKLKEMCVIINGMTEEREKAGIDKIKIVGIKKDDMVKLFVAAAEGLDAAGATLPDEVVNFFNDGIQEGSAPGKAPKKTTPKKEEKAGKKEEKAEPPKKEEKAEPPKKEEKAEPPKKEEKAGKKDINLSPLGSREGSQAYAIDFLLMKGTTLKDAAAEVGSTPSRVKSHVEALIKKRGFKIPCKNGIFKVVKE